MRNNKKAVVFVLIVILGLYFWRSSSSGDAQPSTKSVRMAVFENTFLVNSDGDRIYSLCFGLGGGRERSFPCVYLVNFQPSYNDKDSKSCFDVSYIAEGNYGSHRSNIDDSRRYFLFESSPFDIQVCGKFKPVFGKNNPNGLILEDWVYEADAYLSQYIETDLKRRGYQMMT